MNRKNKNIPPARAPFLSKKERREILKTLNPDSSFSSCDEYMMKDSIEVFHNCLKKLREEL